MTRREEIAENLAAVEARIARACAAAGRPREDVCLVVVTKTYPAEDVAVLYDLGVRDIGENRHPEAARKKDALGSLGDEVTWHFVGGLQSNKATSVAAYADVVHSVDRPKIVRALSKGAARAGRTLDCLVQVNLEGASDDGRAGAAPDDLDALAALVDRDEHLRLRGVMAVAPLGAPPEPAFASLRRLSLEVAGRFPSASMISAGMSGDLEAAVAAGATHVRIGRSVLGERPALR